MDCLECGRPAAYSEFCSDDCEAIARALDDDADAYFDRED